TAPKKLGKDEIDRMVREAEKFAAEDAKKKEEVEAINHADTLVYSTEKSLRDYGDKINQQERGEIESAINDLKQAIKDKQIERIKAKMEDLTKASHKLAEAIYRQTAQAQASENPKAGRGPKEQVVDAEFEETASKG
ncbi:MAG: Hsp70 family protein, partial [Candidatus Binatia bacterium]